MHDAVAVGQLLQISPPKNYFALTHCAGRSLLLAGGIGITPLLCMAERLAQSGADFELHSCTRSLERTAFVGRIQGLAFADRVQLHLDAGAAAQQLDLVCPAAHAPCQRAWCWIFDRSPVPAMPSCDNR